MKPDSVQTTSGVDGAVIEIKNPQGRESLSPSIASQLA